MCKVLWDPWREKQFLKPFHQVKQDCPLYDNSVLIADVNIHYVNNKPDKSEGHFELIGYPVQDNSLQLIFPKGGKFVDYSIENMNIIRSSIWHLNNT